MKIREVPPPDYAFPLLFIPVGVFILAIPFGTLSSCSRSFAPKTEFFWDQPVAQVIVWILFFGPFIACAVLRSMRKINDDEVGFVSVKGKPVDKVLTPGMNYVGYETSGEKAYAVSTIPTVITYEDDAISVDCVIKPEENGAALWRLKQYVENVETLIKSRIKSNADAQTPEEMYERLALTDYGIAIVELNVRARQKAEEKPTNLAKLEADLRASGMPEARVRQIVEQTRLEMME